MPTGAYRPEIIFDQGLGDLFVVRIAGNAANKEAIGSLEFAAEHLGAALLVVVGHQHCAAVHAACSGKKLAAPNLKAVVTAVRNSLPTASTSNDPKALREAVKAKVGAYYDLDSGEVEQF